MKFKRVSETPKERAIEQFHWLNLLDFLSDRFREHSETTFTKSMILEELESMKNNPDLIASDVREAYQEATADPLDNPQAS